MKTAFASALLMIMLVVGNLHCKSLVIEGSCKFMDNNIVEKVESNYVGSL